MSHFIDQPNELCLLLRKALLEDVLDLQLVLITVYKRVVRVRHQSHLDCLGLDPSFRVEFHLIVILILLLLLDEEAREPDALVFVYGQSLREDEGKVDQLNLPVHFEVLAKQFLVDLIQVNPLDLLQSVHAVQG